MIDFFLRRIQRFILPLKIVLLAGSLGALGYLVFRVPPDLGKVVLFSLLLFLFLSLIMSFFWPTNRSLLVSLAISFFLFLRAVGLLSPLNIGLLVIFLLLLGLYLRKK